MKPSVHVENLWIVTILLSVWLPIIFWSLRDIVSELKQIKDKLK